MTKSEYRKFAKALDKGKVEAPVWDNFIGNFQMPDGTHVLISTTTPLHTLLKCLINSPTFKPFGR